jgi:hypothetical protein
MLPLLQPLLSVHISPELLSHANTVIATITTTTTTTTTTTPNSISIKENFQ